MSNSPALSSNSRPFPSRNVPFTSFSSSPSSPFSASTSLFSSSPSAFASIPTRHRVIHIKGLINRFDTVMSMHVNCFVFFRTMTFKFITFFMYMFSLLDNLKPLYTVCPGSSDPPEKEQNNFRSHELDWIK